MSNMIWSCNSCSPYNTTVLYYCSSHWWSGIVVYFDSWVRINVHDQRSFEAEISTIYAMILSEYDSDSREKADIWRDEV